MPLQKLQFRPGINREGTTLANEGGWFDGDKIRFRSGYPEKIGGWRALAQTTFMGVCRSLWNWVTLGTYNLIGVGTNLKFYAYNGGVYNDITPIRLTTGAGATPPTAAPTFDTTNGSATVTVNDASASGLQEGDFVTFSGAAAVGGLDLNNEYQIVSLLSSTQYTITSASAASSTVTGGGGAGTTAAYQINTGFATYTVGTGWGTGPWSRGSWGSGYTTGVGLQLRLWSQANFGQVLLFSPRGGALYVWNPGSSAPSYARGTLVSGTNVPAFINQIMVSDSTRITIAFGCNEFGAYASTVQDPMLIRWSAQEDYTTWTPTALNQAGSYRLSHGSYIVGAWQTRQEILVWTDAAIYSMQYLGPPFVYGLNILADNISIVSPNAMATASGVTYWMGVDKFYVYSGRVETLPCAVRTYIYNDINMEQAFQFFASTNEGFSEIWWFYCSKNSNTIDRYVIFNYLDRVWYYGTMERTAWMDSAISRFPIAATYTGKLVSHEDGVDDNSGETPQPIPCYVQSSDFDIGDGHNYGFVWQVIPDITFDGSTTLGDNKPYATFTVRPRRNPGADYGSSDMPIVASTVNYSSQNTYNVQQFTQVVNTRLRGRQMAFRVSSNMTGTAADNITGIQWQLGTPRLNVRPDGRK